MTESDNLSLSKRQKQALPIFASNLTIEEACERAGISRNTFYEWLKEPQFKLELDRLRNEIVNEAVNHLKITSTKAAKTLGNLLERDDSPTVQRAAANDVLGHVMKFMELKELEDRLADIERHMGRQQ
jgi:DNA-binding CsgD family transcriptional regulator